MPSFSLDAIDLDQFTLGPDYHTFTVVSRRPAADIWAELHSDRPLQWCRKIRAATWTSPSPREAGATREVQLANGARLRERYFVWQEGESDYVNAFYVESANLPLFRRFGERYSVTQVEGGWCLFTWEFYIEPRAVGPLRSIARAVIARDIAAIRGDTHAHFGARPSTAAAAAPRTAP